MISIVSVTHTLFIGVLLALAVRECMLAVRRYRIADRAAAPVEATPLVLVGRGTLHTTMQPLTGDLYRIGRARDNDLVLDAPGISRYHVVITHTSEGWRITNRSGSIGIRLNGRSVGARSAPLQPGDRIDFARPDQSASCGFLLQASTREVAVT